MADLRKVFEMFSGIFKSFNDRLTRIEDHQFVSNRETNAKLDRILQLLGENGNEKETSERVNLDS